MCEMMHAWGNSKQYGLKKQNPRNALNAHESRTREIKHDTVTQQNPVQPWAPYSQEWGSLVCRDWMALPDTWSEKARWSEDGEDFPSHSITCFKNEDPGLPWWCSGWESACQCRAHGFKPRSGKIPHATEQLGPWATTTEPACHNYWSLHA